MPVGYARLDKASNKKSLSLIKSKYLKSNDREKTDCKENSWVRSSGDNQANNSLQDPASHFRQDQVLRTAAAKRPFTEVLGNTTNAVKKIKLTLSEGRISLSQHPSAMLNGYHTDSHSSSYYGGSGTTNTCTTSTSTSSTNNGRKVTLSTQPPPIATLSNLGNTCFLNSVLYTLRFTPNFLHNLHHLVGELALVDQRLNIVKGKSSSLGRNFANFANSTSRSWSTKDLPSLGGTNDPYNGPKSKIQVTTEKMHEMYVSLHAAEMRDNCEPYQAETFLAALRNVNSIFEGNQQQDAHELLMCVLDSIRETCRSLQARFNNQPEIVNGITDQISTEGDPSSMCTKPALGIFRKSWKNRKKAKTFKPDSPTKETNGKLQTTEEECVLSTEWTKNLGFDFVADDFEGTTVLRTTCLECEIVTERKQTMCDISVPIPEDKRLESDVNTDPSVVYQQACVTSECLRDQNKYWCDGCARYNEARRSVTYETLPRLLVLQLKRFSGGMEKLTAHMPTPLTLACFCDTCCGLPAAERPHQYSLYGVIMHLGQTLTGGHYIAYTRANYADYSSSYLCCQRDSKSYLVPNADKPNFMKNLFARKNNGISSGDKNQPIKRKVPLPPGTTVPAPNNELEWCSSLDCCGIRLTKSVWTYGDEPIPDKDVWFMCDDETVKPISYDELDELLSSKPKVRSASTPYLLFYVKNEAE